MTKEDLVNKNILRDRLLDTSNDDSRLGFSKLPFVLGKSKEPKPNDFKSIDKQGKQNG